MPAVSPHASTASHTALLSNSNGAAARPPIMKRQSSQGSHGSKSGAMSPSSVGEHYPMRHHVKAGKTKVKLSRNPNSGRNLAKLGRQAQSPQITEDARRHSRQKSHEGDTHIKLPGSLDENKPHPLRRNLTAYQLPRNTSHAKLKKNLSHGQLTRLGSTKNLAALDSNTSKAPPSPGLKGKKKRPRSADMASIEKDLHEQEVELAQQERDRKDKEKKVGFAVGSSGGDSSEDEDEPQMEGSGMQEDEWTDQSASASPYSTRQNTANNSRRGSVTFDKVDKRSLFRQATEAKANHEVNHESSQAQAPITEADGTPPKSEESEEEAEPPSPHTSPVAKKDFEAQPAQEPSSIKAPQRSPLHGAKDHPNPAARHLLSRNSHNPAPALVSNVSALDDTHSNVASPAPSMRSSQSNVGDGAADHEQDELVSRFMPSTSHPLTGSGGNTTMNTPKSGSFQTIEAESTLAAQHKSNQNRSMSAAPVSPVSTLSASSGAATPAMQRSRTEMRMMNEKAIAEMEEMAARNPVIPPHVYDRRNESLKYYLKGQSYNTNGNNYTTNSGLSMGPEIFQGRFKAVNTELKVVQRFRDPISDSLARLNKCKATKFSHLRSQKPQQKAGTRVPTSKSAVALSRQAGKLATSNSPPRSGSLAKTAMTTAKSSTHVRSAENRRSRVTFSTEPADTREPEPRGDDDVGADAIARQMWHGLSI